MRKFVMVVLASALVTGARAVETPARLAGDSRLGELTYSPDQIFQIPVKKGVATHVILGADESIVASAPGQPSDCRDDRSEWCIVSNVGASDFYVRVNADKAASNNLELKTTKRLYSFHFVQNGASPMFRVRFKFPAQAAEEARAAADPAPAKPKIVAQAPESRSCNWQYSMQVSRGSSGIAPLAAFDDGSNTYLMFGPSVPLPQVYAVAIDGEETLVRARRSAGNVAVLPGIGSAFLLRQDDFAVAVWNDGAAVAGARRPGEACPDWVAA
jgi:type IV secretion system protein VirB9